MMQDRFTGQIPSYLDGELSHEERAEFEAHVRTCGSCQQQLESFKRTADLIEALPITSPSPGFERASIARFDRELFRIPSLTRRIAARLTRPRVAALVGSGIAAAAALVLVLGSWPRTPPVPAPERDEQAISENLELFSDYEVIVNLDVLQAIETMDREGIDAIELHDSTQVN